MGVCAGGGGIRWVYMGDINIPHSMQRYMGTDSNRWQSPHKPG